MSDFNDKWNLSENLFYNFDNGINSMLAYQKHLVDSASLLSNPALLAPFIWLQIQYIKLRNCCVYLPEYSKNEMENSIGRMHKPLIKDFTKGLEIKRPMFYVHPPT